MRTNTYIHRYAGPLLHSVYNTRCRLGLLDKVGLNTIRIAASYVNNSGTVITYIPLALKNTFVHI